MQITITSRASDIEEGMFALKSARLQAAFALQLAQLDLHKPLSAAQAARAALLRRMIRATGIVVDRYAASGAIH